jgi:hypothetical protein
MVQAYQLGIRMTDLPGDATLDQVIERNHQLEQAIRGRRDASS